MKEEIEESKVEIIHSNNKQSVIANWESKELKPETDEKAWVITELEKNEIIKHYWSLDNYLSIKLLDVIENAEAPDHKWELHTDYRTRLRSLETILKLKEKNFGWNGIHVNFFASPKKLKH